MSISSTLGRLFIKCLSICFLFFTMSNVKADHPASLAEITVEEKYTGFDKYIIDPDLVNAPDADTGQLLKKVSKYQPPLQYTWSCYHFEKFQS